MKELKPAALWQYFEEILEIPRPSKKEEKIIGYLEDFAKTNNLGFRKDKVGNCLISKPASPGFEDRSTIVLQSHIDMVGEKLLEIEHDFHKDPIKAVEKDGWIMAEGTTLGADDGIGVAASMAVLTDENLKHGPLECLFTVDEETGMTGAFNLEPGFMKGKILLNLDSEDEGEIYIGCAGGIDTIAEFKLEFETLNFSYRAVRITIEGLRGGHSGDEIHIGYGNSIKLLNRFLWEIYEMFGTKLCSFTGGKMRNAIPREATAIVAVQSDKLASIQEYVASFERIFKDELGDLEPGLKFSATITSLPEKAFTRETQKNLIRTLYACPHGVIGWSQEIEGLVETSTNLAVVREKKNDILEIVTSQRSSSESAKRDIANRLEALFLLSGADVSHSDGYPGWKPDKRSEILNVATEVYTELFNKVPEVKAIHAGLECGLFLEKYPTLDMISFGPTIKGAHTPEERIEISTVEKFWDFLVRMLEKAPKA
jgi:dipeptidase D